MVENTHDTNPARYLVVYGNDAKFISALRDLEETDCRIGEANSPAANSVMVRYLNVLLSVKEDEIQDRIILIQERDLALQERDLALQERDEELQRLINEIHRLYSSKRYKLGNLVINPVERIVSRTRKL